MKHTTIEAVKEVCLRLRPDSFGMADLGCSSGPNTLSIIKDIIGSVEETVHSISEWRVYLNDLPSNDFNSIFKTLPDFRRDLNKDRRRRTDSGIMSHTSTNLYVAAYPGSFYHRLFPDGCLHFVYSSYSLHWLSRV